MEYNNSMYYSRNDRTYTQPQVSLGMVCYEEPLSEVQFKAYKTRMQEYKNYLDSVNRLANAVNVCLTEEPVSVGENGLLTGESLNALQHAGSISVYNFFQQHNWEYPSNPEGEMACIRPHNPVTDEFLDSEQPIRPDWPAVHLTKCFVDQDKAKLHGSALPLRSYLPPTISFRNAADVDDTIEPEVRTNKQLAQQEGDFELVMTDDGVMVQKCIKEGKETQLISVYDFFYGRLDNKNIASQPKGEYRFNCAACQTTLYSNVSLMTHILAHFDENTSNLFKSADSTSCHSCNAEFTNAFDLRHHMEIEHMSVIGPDGEQQVYIDTNNGNVIPTYGCRICEKSCDSNLTLAYHLQQHHREREMPYRCGICNFYTSLYLDLLCHFKKIHSDTNQLICPFCLRTFTINDAQPINPLEPPSASTAGQTTLYYQHMKTHKDMIYKHCTGCTLNFVNKTDFELHRRLDHKTQQLTDADNSIGVNMQQTGANQDSAVVDAREEIFEKHNAEISQNAQQHQQQQQIKKMNAPEPSRVKDLSSLVLPEDVDCFMCLECGDSLAVEKHRRYLPCSMCRFASCCSNSFNRHVLKLHAGQPNAPQLEENALSENTAVELYFKSNPDRILAEQNEAKGFHCSRCAISNLDGNTLTTHLIEECGEMTATLKPAAQLLAAREQVEREHESMNIDVNGTQEVIQEEEQYIEGSEQGPSTEHKPEMMPIVGQPVSLQEEMMVVDQEGAEHAVMGDNGVEMEADQQQEGDLVQGNTIVSGDDNNESYTINIPDNVQLKPKESLLLMILEDGSEELIIVNTDDINCQVMSDYFAQKKAQNVLIVQSNDEEEPNI